MYHLGLNRITLEVPEFLLVSSSVGPISLTWPYPTGEEGLLLEWLSGLFTVHLSIIPLISHGAPRTPTEVWYRRILITVIFSYQNTSQNVCNDNLHIVRGVGNKRVLPLGLNGPQYHRKKTSVYTREQKDLRQLLLPSLRLKGWGGNIVFKQLKAL